MWMWNVLASVKLPFEYRFLFDPARWKYCKAPLCPKWYQPVRRRVFPDTIPFFRNFILLCSALVHSNRYKMEQREIVMSCIRNLCIFLCSSFTFVDSSCLISCNRLTAFCKSAWKKAKVGTEECLLCFWLSYLSSVFFSPLFRVNMHCHFAFFSDGWHLFKSIFSMSPFVVGKTKHFFFSLWFYANGRQGLDNAKS